jgi:hypothetical protein
MIYKILFNILFNTLLVLFNWYFINDFNICLLLISLDNTAYGLNFLMNNIDHNLTYKDIINVNNRLYKLQIFERYVFYIILTITYYFIKIFILNKYVFYLKIILSFLAIPLINNIIYDEYIIIFDKLKQSKEKLIKLIFCEQIFNIIKKLNKTYIDNKIDLDKTEIISVLIKSNNFKTEIITFIKNTLIVILLNYFKSKSFIYYKLIKYIYIYNSGIYFINNINVKEATEKFIEIFKNKNYAKINDPMTIHSMLFLYYNKKTETDWNVLYAKINYNIITFLTLWTFGSFFESIYRLEIIILLSIFIRYTKKNITNLFNKKYIISLLCLLLGYVISENIIWISFIHQFGYYLINNFIMKGILNTCHNSIYIYLKKNYKNILVILHENFISYIKNITYALFMKYLFIYNLHYAYSFILFITNTEKCKYTQILYGIMYISIQNSNKFYKLIILAYIGSLIINLIKKYDIIKQITTNILNNDINAYTIPETTSNELDYKLYSELNSETHMYNIEDEIKNAMENISDDEIIDNDYIENNKNNLMIIDENHYK